MGEGTNVMERTLALEVLHVTEAAALACARMMGQGDEHLAYHKAMEAMKNALDNVRMDGVVILGEGEPGETPELFTGQRIGTGDPPQVDIALDPLEGTTICATGGPNSISIIAIGEKGSFLSCPDGYMEKIAVGPQARGAIDLNLPPRQNLRNIADALGCYLEDLTVAILDRPRHTSLIREVRETGARIKLIGDGDVSAAIAPSIEGSGVDVLMGIGGAKEGILTAAALQCTRGDIQGRLLPKDQDPARGAASPVLTIQQMVREDNVMFIATGVTDGDNLKGVRFYSGGATTYSLVMQSRSRTLRFIETHHRFQG